MSQRQALKSARWAIALSFFVDGFLYAGLMGRIPALKAQLQLNEAQLGQALLCLGLGAMFALMLTRWVLRWIPGHRLAPLSLLGVCAVFMTIAWSPSLLVFSLLLTLMGCLLGWFGVAANMQAMALEQRLNGAYMSGLHAMFSFGGVVGSLMSAGLAHLLPSTHFAMVGAPTVLLVAWLASRLLKTDYPTVNKSSQLSLAERIQQALPSRFILMMAALTGICYLSEGALTDWGALHLKESLGSSEAVAPLGYASFSAAMAITRLFGDRLRMMVGDMKLLMYHSLLATCGLVTIIWSPSVVLSILGFTLCGLGFSVLVPILFSIAGKHARSSQEAASVLSMFGYTGLLLGPSVIGFVAEAFNLRIALSLLIVLCLLMALQALSMRQRLE